MEKNNEKILSSLQNPEAQLPNVLEDAAILYAYEFSNIRAEKQVSTPKTEDVLNL